MTEFHFCPVCGSTLAERQLPTEDRPRLVCTACGHILYLNPKVVSGTLPVSDNRVWLLRRGIEPRLGYWSHPAGFQELDESTEEAAIRETWEELGCVVELTRLLGVYSRAGASVNVVFLATFTRDGGLPRTTPEALEVRAFAANELPWDELAFPSTYSILRDWLQTFATENGV